MAIPNQVFAGAAVIPNNAPAAAIRNMAECTSKLTRKGEIYIGTGESATETSQTGDSYKFYKTQSQNIIEAINDNLKDSLIGVDKANTIKDDTEKSGQSSNTYKSIKNILLDSVYPIGSIYISVSDVSPAKFLGGTWEEFAKGRTIVGVNSKAEEEGETSQTIINFLKKSNNAIGTYGHSHHTQRQPNSALSVKPGTLSAMFGVADPSAEILPYNADLDADKVYPLYSVGNLARKNGQYAFTDTDSAEDPRTNSMQPSITVFMWKRVS